MIVDVFSFTSKNDTKYNEWNIPQTSSHILSSTMKGWRHSFNETGIIMHNIIFTNEIGTTSQELLTRFTPCCVLFCLVPSDFNYIMQEPILFTWVHWFILFSQWINDHMCSKIWEEITYIFPNLNDTALLMPNFTVRVIAHPYWSILG